MTLAGCQIHYAIETEFYSKEPMTNEIIHEGKNIITKDSRSKIYNADVKFKPKIKKGE